MKINGVGMRYVKHGRRVVKRVGALTGFDTETLESGYAFLLADEDGSHRWVRSDLDVISFIVDGKQRVCFNMDFDGQSMLKWFGEDFCSELHHKGSATYKGVHVTYVPHKFLYFRSGNVVTKFWDVSQYYSMHGRRVNLTTAAKRVGMEKKAFDVGALNDSYYGNAQLLDYCVHDAKIAGELGRCVLHHLSNNGIAVTTLASLAAIAESYIVDQVGVKLPDLTEIPSEALQYALNAIQPPWREFFKRGYFEIMYDYDISSAFPAVIRNLPDLNYGRWEYASGKVPENARLGYIRCLVNIPDSEYVPWITFRNKFGHTFEPVGKFMATLTLNGFRSQKRMPRVVDGWFWVSDIVRTPFRTVVDDLFSLKCRAGTDSVERYLIKTMLASIYGKFRQVIDRGVNEPQTGRLYNPFYVAEILTDTRLRVCDLARRDTKSLIGVHTDCVYSTHELNVRLGEGIGDWELRGTSSMLVVGLNHFEKGDRGFLRFAMNRDFDESSCLARYGRGLRPVSFANAIRSKRFESMGVFLPFEERVDVIDQVYKRRWLKTPKCCGDLLSTIYDSRPYHASVVDVFNTDGEVLWEL